MATRKKIAVGSGLTASVVKRDREFPRLKYVVVVQRSPLQKDIYGPYTKFKTAEGDAKAWNGSVEELKTPEQGVEAN